MNFALSDEQMLLREAARGSLSRFKTIEAAREALEDPSALPDLWPMAIEAGWPGLLIDEEHGGAGLGAFDALLVAEECGRVLAGVPLLGLLPATAILNAAGDESLAAVAAGELRPAYVPARPPSDLEQRWTVDPRSGFARGRRADAPASTATRSTLDGDGRVRARRAGRRAAGGGRRRPPTASPVAVAVPRDAAGLSIEPVTRYDATRSLGHVTIRIGARAPARRRRRRARRRLVPRAGADRRRVARRGADVPRRERRLRQGAVHVRPRDRLLPGDQARADRGPAPARERARAAVLRRLGARVEARGVPARGERRALGRRACARLRRSLDDQRARRDRRDLGARRAAVLPPRAALAAAARRARTTRPIGWPSRTLERGRVTPRGCALRAPAVRRT